MMPERLFHACDTVAAAAGAIVTSAGAAMIAVIRPYDPDDQLWQTLLPLIGVTLVAAGAVLLNPATETRKIVIGRSVIGGFFGWISPSICIAIAPNILPEWAMWIVEVLRWPMAMIGMGGVITGIAYILSRPFFARAYERADAIAQDQIDRLQKLAQGPNNTVVVVSPEIIPKSNVTEKLKP